MKRILLNTDNARVSSDAIHSLQKKLAPHIITLAEARTQSYNTEYASINIPFDSAMHVQIKKTIAAKKNLNPSLLIVIGIGGSNLGTMAVLQALYGRLYNEQEPHTRVHFADTVDTEYIQDIVLLTKKELHKGGVVLLNVITKSGTTIETIAHFTLFLDILRAFYPDDYHKYIVITTDADSPLHACALSKNITCLEVPQKVGGRYSVFSAVGLFPLGLLGIDIDELINGAQQAVTDCTHPKEYNIAAHSASVRYQQYMHGIHINDLFLFSVDLENIGKWYRQLMGESIGKEKNIHGEKVEVGITPTVSLGTADLHSVAQLYLGGPRDKLAVFVSVQKTPSHYYIPTHKECSALDVGIYGKSIAAINHAILTGVCDAYDKTERPYMQLIIQEKTAFYVGQLLQYMMIEMMYLGYLFEVNPFDQPQVELYKQKTRKILDNE